MKFFLKNECSDYGRKLSQSKEASTIECTSSLQDFKIKFLILRGKKQLVYFIQEIARTAPASVLLVFIIRDSGSKMKIHIKNIIIFLAATNEQKKRN